MMMVRSVLVLAPLWALLALSSCRPAAAQTPTGKPAPAAGKPAPAAAAPAPAATPAPEDPPQSWSDPRVLARLAQSCAFDPDTLPAESRESWLGPGGPGETSPISCDAGLDQSCVFDPCFQSQEEECKPRCTAGCKDCGKGCVASCETCRAGCTDAACRATCARSCATCREGCVRQRDRCATGTCTAQYKQCRDKLRQEWRRNGCSQICKTYVACENRCLARHKSDKDDTFALCAKPCRKAIKNRGCDFSLCQGSQFSMGIDPEDKSE